MRWGDDPGTGLGALRLSRQRADAAGGQPPAMIYIANPAAPAPAAAGHPVLFNKTGSTNGFPGPIWPSCRPKDRRRHAGQSQLPQRGRIKAAHAILTQLAR